jgi:hypothetical protein
MYFATFMLAVSAPISDLNSVPSAIFPLINHWVFRDTADVSVLDISELKIFAKQNPSLIRVKKTLLMPLEGEEIKENAPESR